MITYYCRNCGVVSDDPDYYEDCMAYYKTANKHLETVIDKSHSWKLADLTKLFCEYCGEKPGKEGLCNSCGVLFNNCHNFLTTKEFKTKMQAKREKEHERRRDYLLSFGFDINDVEVIRKKNESLIKDFIAKQIIGQNWLFLVKLVEDVILKSYKSGKHSDTLHIEQEDFFTEILLQSEKSKIVTKEEVGISQILNSIDVSIGKYNKTYERISLSKSDIRLIELKSIIKTEVDFLNAYLIENNKECNINKTDLEELLKIFGEKKYKHIHWISLCESTFNLNVKQDNFYFIDLNMFCKIMFDLEIGVNASYKIYEPDNEFFNPIRY